MHIGNSDPEVGPPFVVGASGGLCCIEGIRQKAGMRKLKACWGAGGRFFAAQKHRNRLCAVSGGTVTRSGPWAGRPWMHKAAGIWRSAPFLCAFTPHEFFCPEGLGKRQNTGRPLPCRVLRALSSAECEKSSRAKWPGSFCVDLTCGPQRTYSESAPPSCWNSRTHCRTRRRHSRRCRSERCRHPHRR